MLKSKEIEIMREVINLGHHEAATSFSSLTGQAVAIESTHIEFSNDHDYIAEKFDPSKKLTILQTDIIGEISGASYLIFDEEEKTIIARMSLAAFGNNSSLEDSVILKEIDNILSATVITQLSNTLEVKIYGDVPQFFEVENIHDLDEVMQKSEDEYYLLAHTNFMFEGYKMISPMFIWKMHKDVAQLIKTELQ